jgi:hypothetical protein
MDKDKEGIVSSALDTAGAGLKGAKDVAVSVGSAVGGTVSTVAKRARRMVTRKRSPSKKTTAASRATKSTTRRGTAKKTATKRGTTKRVAPKDFGREQQTYRDSPHALANCPAGKRSPGGGKRKAELWPVQLQGKFSLSA